MKRVLFGVDSYFQLMGAVNLRTTLYKEWDADVIIYNSIPSAGDVVERLRHTNVFGKVYFAETSLTRCGKKYTFKEKFPKYFVYFASLFCPNLVLNNVCKERISSIYDEFVFNGYGALPDCIFNSIYKSNNNAKCKRYEDGYLSYYTVYGSEKSVLRKKIETIIETFTARKDIDKYVNGIYFMEPDLVLAKFPYPVIEAPKLSRQNKQLVETLNFAFDYKDKSSLNKRIYIFEDGGLFFNANNEEVDIVKALLAGGIPASDFVVKMHPRRTEDRFKALGVETIGKSNVPWELIQLNNKFDDDFFITVASSIVFSSDIYFGDKCHKVLLVNCLKHNAPHINETFKQYINAFKKKYGEDSLLMPNTYDELVEYINNIIN